MLKKQHNDICEESQVSQEYDELEDKINTGEVPKDIKNLKSQYEVLLKNFKQKQLALADAEKEYNDDKFDHIDQIRDQRKDVNFYTKIIMSSLSNDDLDKLRFKSKWMDSDNSFQIPGFLHSGKKITFPKIQKYELLATWQQIKGSRYIQFTNDDFFEDLKGNSNTEKCNSNKENYGYSMAQIVESNAECEDNYSLKAFEDKSNVLNSNKGCFSNREGSKISAFQPISSKKIGSFNEEQKMNLSRNFFQSQCMSMDPEVPLRSSVEDRPIRGIRLKPLEEHTRGSTSLNPPDHEINNRVSSKEKSSQSLENKGRKPPGGKLSKIAIPI